uniref:Methuselah N-terminal domain-containing protein n=1 Tax=Musca domestica TaxID=7370 RepID=A0A1I8MZL9_MUSDO
MFSRNQKQINSKNIEHPTMLTSLLLLLMLAPWCVGAQYPCAFMDTVNITGSYPHETHLASSSSSGEELTSNHSYIYKWMVVPPDLVAIYDFIMVNGQRVNTARHLRACVCKLKPCIRFCCNPGFYYNLQDNACQSLPSNDTTNLDQQAMPVRFGNGSTIAVNSSSHFLVNIGAPCENMSLVLKDNNRVNWLLYENGSIIHKQRYFSKHYCYSPLATRKGKDDETFVWHWEPLTCVPDRFPFTLGVREWTYAICLIITVICMIIVLFIYLLCTELRNTFYGVAIKTYTLCIIIGYSLLAHLTLTNPMDMTKYACNKIPIFAMLYLILSFYILTFISFNFYLSFFGILLSKLMFWFMFFPTVLITACWSFFVSYTSYNNRPVFGSDICWFDPRNYSIIIYFYAPILLACIFSGIFYILSLLRIGEMTNGDSSKMSVFTTHNCFQSFWIFVGYTLFAWLVCICSFVINYYRRDYTHINYVVCLFVAFHGFGAMYALLGKNQQVQQFLRRIDDDMDNDDMAEISVPMTTYS